MARRVAPARPLTGPVLVLDAQGLSLLADDDRAMMARLHLALREQYLPVLSAVTIVEQRRSGTAGRRLAFLRSKLTVVAVSEQIADFAATLLDRTGLDRHECVIDAIVVATAAGAIGPAKVVSSDGSHLPALCKVASEGRTSPVEWIRV
jgi:hypothetical protein